MNTIQEGFLLLDSQGTILRANQWMEERFAPFSPLAGKKCYAVLREESQPCPECFCAGKTPTEGDLPPALLQRDAGGGQSCWLQTKVYPLRGGSGHLASGIVHVTDITQQKRIEEELKDELHRRRLLVEQSRDGIVVLQEDGKVYEANEQFARMLGYTMEEVHQLYMWNWQEGFTHEELLDMIATVDATGDHFEQRHRRKDGTYLAVDIATNGAVIGGQKLVFCVCRDISEKKMMEEQIRELALRDPLTNTYNRRYIFARLEEMEAEYQRSERDFCLSIMDLDNFKTVNDTYGHVAGDYVLKEFADTLASSIRKCDLLGRYGGEEFIIVSKEAGLDATTMMIDRVMDVIRNQTIEFEDAEIRLTFSCGIVARSEFPLYGCSVETLLHRADARLYAAKGAGRDCYIA